MQMKTALVTGAATGSERRSRSALRSDGYRVAMVDTDSERARAQAQALPDAVAYATDVTDEAASKRCSTRWAMFPKYSSTMPASFDSVLCSSTASRIFAR